MMNPWVLLGLVLFWGASVTGAYIKGGNVQEDKDKAAQVTAVTQAVDEANRVAKQDKATAVKAATRRAAAQTRMTTIRGEAIETIREVPMPAVCDWNDRAMTVLNAAVSNANDKEQSKGVESGNGTR